MIDLSDFIVDIENAKSSRKLYKMTCDKCGCDRGYQRKNRHGFGLCKYCVSSFIHKKKTVSIDTRNKMSSSAWLKNGGTHPLLGKRHSLETKAKISNKTAAQNKNYISKHPYNGTSGIIMMKSSWEVKYAQYLDSTGIEWAYEPEFKLSNGYSYLPDFQLSTGDIIEVKGYMRQDAQKKWDLFCSDYPTLNKSLIRKDDLKKLGII